MLRPEFSGVAFDVGADFDAVAPASASGGEVGFSALFGELRAEIADFIENGSAGLDTARMNAEGRLHQARISAGISTLQAPGEEGGDNREFLAAIAPLARETGERLGVSPDIIAAHAALESGWGRKPLRQADGADTHNLFGLKADGNWSGESTRAATTEYENGAPQQKVERFRSYPDAAGAFKDFTRLLLNNPRYQGALNTGGDIRAYAQGLVRGGYATDPAYADKLVRVARRLQSGD